MEEGDSLLKKKWKQKRCTTFLVYSLLYFNCGFEQTLTVTTSWVYVSTLMMTENKSFYYALINMTQYVPPLLLASLVARYGDRTRNIKCALIIINILSLSGAFLYMLPNPVYCSVIGQFLSGFIYVQRPLMIGEIARSYSKNELKTKYSCFTGWYGVGSALGPCLAYFFIDVDFYICNLHVRYGNVPGLIRAIQVVISLILIVVFVHDLSKEYDYKEESQDLVEIQCNKDKPFMLKFFKEGYLVFLLFLAFFTNFVEAIFFVLYPVFVVKVLHLNTYIVNLCYILPFLVYPILTFIMSRNPNSGKVYYLGVIAWLLLLLIGLLEILINRSYPSWLNIVLLIALTLVTQIFAYLTLVFILVTLSNLVQSKHQSLLDSIRCHSRQLGSVTGSLLGAYVAHSKNLMGYSLMFTSIVILLLTILRKKQLENPKIIF